MVVPKAANVEESTRSSQRVGWRGRSARRSLMLGDALVVVVAVLVVSLWRGGGDDAMFGEAALLISYVVFLARHRLYHARFVTRRADEIGRVVRSGLFSGAGLGLAAFALDWQIDKGWWLGVTGASILALTIHREIRRRRFASLRRTGQMSRAVILVGKNAEARQFEETFENEPALGYRVVDTIDPNEGDSTNITTRVLASARSNGAHGAIVAASAIDSVQGNRLVRDLIEAGIHVELTSTLADIASDRLTVRPLGRFPVVYIEPRNRGGWRAWAKGSFDKVVAGLALLMLAPVMAGIAVGVKLTSPGPVLFRQTRVGRNGVDFELLKFRTMVVDAEALLEDLVEANEGSGPLFKMERDPRVTRVGAFLRKTSLDELPQLWNVLRNEMSLVGPRPALRSEMAEWDDDLFGRLRVKPGITGMWQVSGRSSTSFEEYTRLDLYYVDNWSLVIDVAILLKTIPAVLRSEGAY